MLRPHRVLLLPIGANLFDIAHVKVGLMAVQESFYEVPIPRSVT